MKLIFVGTSHGVPEKDRRCSSYLLEVGGSYYIIDMGTQTIEDLRRREIAIENVRLVICTHPHGDHTDGLVSFVDLLNWYFKQAQTKILVPDERLIPLLKAWAQISDNGKPVRDDLFLSAYAAGIAYEDEHLRLTAIPTQHCANAYAFLVEAEGKKLLFTGDLCRPDVDFPTVAFETELDLIICELAHFSPDTCVAAFDRTKAKRILHTHINESRWRDALSAQLNRPHPYAYGAAYDGMELEL